MENDEDMEKWKAERERLRQERRQVAEDFYNRDASLTPKQRQEQLRGINYDREVKVGYIEKGEHVEQHQPASRQTGPHAQGTYLAPVGSSKENLGVEGEHRQNPGRERDLFVANKRTEVLHSTASDTDSWSKDPKKDGAELYYGGGEQMVCHHGDKQNFDRVIQNKQQSAMPQQSTANASQAQARQQQADHDKTTKPPTGEYENARKQARENQQRSQEKDSSEERTKQQAETRENRTTAESPRTGKSR